MFILLTKKQKKDFVDYTCKQIEIALQNSGRKIAVSTKYAFKQSMYRKVKLIK